MAILECSKTLLTQLIAMPEVATPPLTPKGSLGNWCASMLELDDRRALLFLCQRTYLNFIILEGHRFDTAAVAQVFWAGLSQTLGLIGVNSDAAKLVEDSYSVLVLARISSTSWTGRLNAVSQDYKHRVRLAGGIRKADVGSIILAENNRPRAPLQYATLKEITFEVLACSDA